jgi:hypothetical protein
MIRGEERLGEVDAGPLHEAGIRATLVTGGKGSGVLRRNLRP